MHGVRGVCRLVFFLVLIFSFFFPAVYADQATDITDPAIMNGSVNETFNQSANSSAIDPTITPTPEPTVTETLTLTPVTTEPTPEVMATETVQSEESLQIAADKAITTAPTERTCSDSSSDETCSSSAIQCPLMHLSKAQLDEEEAQYKTLEKYTPARQKAFISYSSPVSKSLLSYLSYIPAERYQGTCGDCWVWASTGALEVDRTVKTGINERLSVQYFNSKYNNGQGSHWACCGGDLGTFTTWYGSDKSPIPWSNTNAAFGDTSQSCYSYATAVPISTISTTPHYQLKSISYSPISTYGVGQSTAIANIQSAIDNNKAVWYGFNYNYATWTTFRNFWGTQAESVIWDPDSYGGQADGGGHAVLIVGYDTSDPSNPYWIVLNSWGAPSGRPNGLFRLKMNMNYDNTYSPPDNYVQHKFFVLDSEFEPADKVGVFRQSTNSFYLRPSDYPTTRPTTINWGASTDLPVTGDWDGDGTTEVGVYRQSTHKFYLRPSDFPTTPTTKINWGISTDLPVTGKWNGDGTTEVGIYRQSTHKFYLRPGDWPTTPRTTINWGASTDLPVTGDWDGDGTTEVGVYRQSTHKFYLRPSDYPTTRPTTINWGISTDLPVTGDWNGDGTTEVGIYRQSTHTFSLRPSDWPTHPVIKINWGVSTDLPVTGKWS